MIFCVDDDSAIRDIEVYTLQQTGFLKWIKSMALI